MHVVAVAFARVVIPRRCQAKNMAGQGHQTKSGPAKPITSSSAIAEGPRDALSQLKSCQLLHNCTKNHI